MVTTGLQAPLAHVGVVTMRVSFPLVLHVPVETHGPNGLVVGVSQLVPSVSRVHVIDSLAVDVVHVPETQLDVVTSRDIVPLSAHVSPNSHGPNVPVTGAAHEIPSVARLHASLSGAVLA
jgi:hypothetical protein